MTHLDLSDLDRLAFSRDADEDTHAGKQEVQGLAISLAAAGNVLVLLPDHCATSQTVTP